MKICFIGLKILILLKRGLQIRLDCGYRRVAPPEQRDGLRMFDLLFCEQKCKSAGKKSSWNVVELPLILIF